MEYKADERHAEYIINALNLQESNPLSTPQEADQPWKHKEEAVLLDGEKAYEYRSLAARANYFAVDRMDIQNAVKEMCKQMTQPNVGDWRKLKRLDGYLKESQEPSARINTKSGLHRAATIRRWVLGF